MIVGLAPGKHGANRTGIPFTGDASGELLFRTLGKLALPDHVVITNAVKCLPVNNKPAAVEIANCQQHLRPEIATHLAQSNPVILALGKIAHDAVLKAMSITLAQHPFVHGRHHRLAGASLVDSYHCSRYNTQTGRLTPAMFEQAVAKAANIARLAENPGDIGIPKRPVGKQVSMITSLTGCASSPAVQGGEG